MTVGQRFDLVVVGGGIHGVGVAQAAAAGGYRVLLLEQTSLAAGTSSRSSKLVHGGLRYLETAQLPLVRESLAEREWLLRMAPTLVQRRAVFPSRVSRNVAANVVSAGRVESLRRTRRAAQPHRVSSGAAARMDAAGRAVHDGTRGRPAVLGCPDRRCGADPRRDALRRIARRSAAARRNSCRPRSRPRSVNCDSSSASRSKR